MRKAESSWKVGDKLVNAEAETVTQSVLKRKKPPTNETPVRL